MNDKATALVETIRRAQSGDASARDNVVEGMTGLVYKIASQLQLAGHKQDMVQAGLIGVLEAIPLFDCTRDIAPSTFFAWRIKAKLHEYIKSNRIQVKVCSNDNERKAFYFARAEKQLRHELGREPTDQEIADRIGIPVDTLTGVKNVLQAGGCRSMNQIDANTGLSLSDSLADPNEDTSEQTASAMYAAIFDSFVDTCDAIDEAIFTLRMVADEPISGEQIATMYNVTRQAISLREKALKARLHKYLVKINAI
jgi:RNA polymerase primary sigma factor